MLPDVRMPCIPVYEDIEGAIQIAQNPVANFNPKHIDVRHHSIRELVTREMISSIHVASQYHADFVAEVLPTELFSHSTEVSS